jgi:hypothetical protein
MQWSDCGELVLLCTASLLPCASSTSDLAADGPPVNCFLPGGLLRSFSNTLAMGPQSIHPAGLQRAFCFQQRPPSAAPRCVPI